MAANIPKQLAKLAGPFAALFGAGWVVNTTMYNVPAGHRGVIYDRFRGVLDEEEAEGTHFLIPVVQDPIIIDVTTRPRSVSVSTGSKDLQTINLTLRVLFRPKRSKLAEIYKTIGLDYEDRVLPSIVNEVMKSVIAKYDAAEMITQRTRVSQSINEMLEERAARFNLILDDISIVHLTFGREFSQAVEMKQVAQQEAEKARFMVEKAEQIKLANIIRAEGDAEAADLIAKAIGKSGEGLIELRKIETATDIARSLSMSRNVTYLPSTQGILMNLPAGQ